MRDQGPEKKDRNALKPRESKLRQPKVSIARAPSSSPLVSNGHRIWSCSFRSQEFDNEYNVADVAAPPKTGSDSVTFVLTESSKEGIVIRESQLSVPMTFGGAFCDRLKICHSWLVMVFVDVQKETTFVRLQSVETQGLVSNKLLSSLIHEVHVDRKRRLFLLCPTGLWVTQPDDTTEKWSSEYFRSVAERDNLLYLFRDSCCEIWNPDTGLKVAQSAPWAVIPRLLLTAQGKLFAWLAPDKDSSDCSDSPGEEPKGAVALVVYDLHGGPQSADQVMQLQPPPLACARIRSG